MSDILNAKNIVKSFGEKDNKINVINEVSLKVKQGEFITIMGSSGSGKSTLLHSLSGMDKIDSGSIKLLNIEINKLKEKEISNLRKEKLGFIFQYPTLLPSLDILDNILLPFYDNKSNRKHLITKAKNLMKNLNLEHLENRRINEVSGGQLQRACICRAILNDPEILFGDEPTGSLNSKQTNEILDIFDNLNSMGMTIVLVTHDPKVSIRSNRVVFMKDGRLVSELIFENKYDSNNLLERLQLVNSKMEEIGI